MQAPIVAIIGCPNAGKSSLFNRLAGYRKAIVSPFPGTTRDRNFQLIEDEKTYLLVDTGGVQLVEAGELEESILKQAQLAIEEASLIIFLIDAKEGITKADHEVVKMLRKSKKDLLLVASKSDSGQEDITDFYRLGLGDPIRLSATHGSGIEELREELQRRIGAVEVQSSSHRALRIAVIGRPNVGKSSFINTLLGSERCIVSEIPGTTVDASDISFDFQGEKYVLVDTAGIKRRGKRGVGVDKYSFLRSIRATETADVCLLLIDGNEGITKQDLHSADFILQTFGGLIIVVNKWDLAEKGEEAQQQFLNRMRYELDFLSWAPVVFVSSKTGKNLQHVFPLAQQIKKARTTRITTGVLNNWLEKVTHEHYPSGAGMRIPRVLYLSQIGIEPPHFILKVNNSEWLHFSYARYLENRLRETFGFEGTAIRFEVKGRNDAKR